MDSYLFCVVLVAYLIKFITGFGNTLVINSLLSFTKENKFITPVDLILGLPINVYMAWKDRKSIDLKIVIPLSITVVIGNIIGIFFLHIGGDEQLKSILGIVLIILSIEMYTRDKKKIIVVNKNSKKFFVFAVGIMSGVLMGLYGIGALLAAYINRQTDHRSNYRANLCFIFIIDNIFRFIGYCYNGIMNSNIVLISLCLVPATLIGMFLGQKLDAKVPEKFIENSIMLLLFITGVIYIATNKFGLL